MPFTSHDQLLIDMCVANVIGFEEVKSSLQCTVFEKVVMLSQQDFASLNANSFQRSSMFCRCLYLDLYHLVVCT